ncbi:hypothetical protein [uncultured Bacteroides sp.]|uniref:hypothetical protein n=1 Tax=uncultured Bacteroides sp. TaxID=162156 RepID=UPI002AAB1E08|nr:hypothetical protein [uncultured Bacteroides sp.]
MNINFENIIPWNGANDTGYDVRLKWQRNFEKIGLNFKELTDDQTAIFELITEIESLINNKLSKTSPDVAQFLINFLSGATFGDFTDSMTTGLGAGIFPDGRIQAQSIEIRGAAKFLELIYNRLTAMEGNFSFSECGTIDAVEHLEGSSYKLHIRKRYEEDFLAFVIHDIVYGIYKQTGGFFTSYMEVVSIDTVNNSMIVNIGANADVPGGINYPPCAGMNISRRGNFVDTARQSSWYISSYDGQIVFLDGVNSYKVQKTNRALVVGLPTDLPIPDGLPINPEQPYVYARGLIVQDLIRINYQGQIVKTIVDRGLWEADPKENAGNDWPYINGVNEQHDCYYKSCKWRCITAQATKGLPPKWNNNEWINLSGDQSAIMAISSSAGKLFRFGQENTTLQSKVSIGTDDITADIVDGYTWSRTSGMPEEDTAWNTLHASNITNTLDITPNDMPSNYFESRKVAFKCSCYVRDGEDITDEFTINR